MLAAARQHCCSCNRTTAVRLATSQRGAPLHRLLPHGLGLSQLPPPQQQRFEGLPFVVPAQLSSHRWMSSSSSSTEAAKDVQQPRANGGACALPSRKPASPIPEQPLPPHKFRLDREVSSCLRCYPLALGHEIEG